MEIDDKMALLIVESYKEIKAIENYLGKASNTKKCSNAFLGVQLGKLLNDCFEDIPDSKIKEKLSEMESLITMSQCDDLKRELENLQNILLVIQNKISV